MYLMLERWDDNRMDGLETKVDGLETRVDELAERLERLHRLMFQSSVAVVIALLGLIATRI
jgi:hypothetical protein